MRIVPQRCCCPFSDWFIYLLKQIIVKQEKPNFWVNRENCRAVLASFHQHKHVWDFLGGHIWHHVFLINTYLAKFELKKDSLCGSLECSNPVERFRNLRNLKFMELRMKFLKAFGTIYNFICEYDRNIYRDSALLFDLTLLTFFSLFFFF